MERIAKYYIPLLAVFLYFAGFYYIAEYFRFFGITAGYREFRLDQYIFFSFAVVYELLVFNYGSLSVKLLLLIAFLFIVHALPNYCLDLGHSRLKCLRPLFAKRTVPLFPFVLRVAVGGLASFLFLFFASATIGKNHACERLSSSRATVTLVGFDTNSIDHDIRKHFSSAHEAGKLTEVWRTDDVIYLSETIRNCKDDPRILYVLGMDDFRFSVVKRIN